MKEAPTRGGELPSRAPRASSCLTRGHWPLLSACASSQALHRHATVGNVHSSTGDLLDTAQHGAEAPACRSAVRSLPRSLTLRCGWPGRRCDTSGLCGRHIHRIASLFAASTTDPHSHIVDLRHPEVQRCLAHCSRSHCLPVPSEVPLGLTADTVARLTGMPSGALLSGCVRRRLTRWCRSGHRMVCMAVPASVQGEPSAPARSAASMRCVAHDLKGGPESSHKVPSSLELLRDAARQWGIRWVRAVGMIAAAPTASPSCVSLCWLAGARCRASLGWLCPRSQSEQPLRIVWWGKTCVRVVWDPSGGLRVSS